MKKISNLRGWGIMLFGVLIVVLSISNKWFGQFNDATYWLSMIGTFMIGYGCTQFNRTTKK